MDNEMMDQSAVYPGAMTEEEFEDFLGEAIVEYAPENGMPLPEIRSFQASEKEGAGIVVRIAKSEFEIAIVMTKSPFPEDAV